MARNRKYNSGTPSLTDWVKLVVLLVFVGALAGVGYVWQKSQIYKLGQQIKKRELCLAELRYQNEKLRQQLATLQSPTVLEARVRELDLGLVPMGAQQEVFTLIEPQPEPVVVETGREYTARQAGVAVVQ